MGNPSTPITGDVPVRGPWMKSSFSSPNGNCVELAELLHSDDIAVRNSRDPHGPAVVYTRAEIEAFVLGAAAGDFAQFTTKVG